MRKITRLENTSPQPVKRKRVAAYARVSSGKEAQLHSISSQISYYNNYIGSREDWELAGIYADSAMTGTKENRPEFQRMISDCRAGKIDMVITKSITRMARNTVTLLTTVRELKELEIDVYFEKENIHTLSTDGELMLTLLASFAQEESRSVSENLKWRIRKKFEQGIPTYIDMYGYRFEDNTLKVIPEEAKIIKQIFTDYLSGKGRNGIAKKLNRQGIPAKTGGLWNGNTIRNILHNEKYTGDLLLQKYCTVDPVSKKKVRNHGEFTMYSVQGSHEPIIDKDTFAKVQEEINRRREKMPPAIISAGCHLFTGLIRCGLCGKLYYRRVNHRNTKYVKFEWICRTFDTLGKEACPSQIIPEEILITKTSEVLEMTDWNREDLLDRIAEIRVPNRNTLLYIFQDGHTEEVHWQHRSRRESWTPEMRRRAGELTRERARKRKMQKIKEGEDAR